MPKVGGKRKKTRTHKEMTEDDELIMDNIPKSFIFKRGKVPNMIKNVVSDMREIMHPYTSLNLKESNKSKFKEYISTAKALGISHFQIFTSSEKHNYLRFIKNPEGPTITFKIISYCTRKDVSNNQNRKKQFSRNFKPPVLVMSGFGKELTSKNVRNPPSKEQYSVVSQMIQSMFPALNLQKAKINNIQRVVLFNYDYNKDIVYLRHFHISLVPVSSNKVMQKVLRARQPPNLRDYKDYSEFLNKKKAGASGNVSESEADDVPDANLELDKKTFKKQFTTKLHEIGPRLKLRLYKIEEGMLKGNVIYNRIVEKKGEEIEAQRKKILEQRALKEKRRLEQEKNVRKKKKEQKEKQKAKELLQKQKSENKKKDEEENNNFGEFGEYDEGEEDYDEPDEEQIIQDQQVFQKTKEDEENKKQQDDEEEDLQHYHGLDEENQDFDDEFSEEESEQFIQDLEKQLKQLQQENLDAQDEEFTEEEDEEGDEEEEDDE